MKLLEHTTDELQSIGGHDLIEISRIRLNCYLIKTGDFFVVFSKVLTCLLYSKTQYTDTLKNGTQQFGTFKSKSR